MDADHHNEVCFYTSAAIFATASGRVAELVVKRYFKETAESNAEVAAHHKLNG
jgi:hypothetical protein